MIIAHDIGVKVDHDAVVHGDQDSTNAESNNSLNQSVEMRVSDEAALSAAVPSVAPNNSASHNESAEAMETSLLNQQPDVPVLQNASALSQEMLPRLTASPQSPAAIDTIRLTLAARSSLASDLNKRHPAPISIRHLRLANPHKALTNGAHAATQNGGRLVCPPLRPMTMDKVRGLAIPQRFNSLSSNLSPDRSRLSDTVKSPPSGNSRLSTDAPGSQSKKTDSAKKRRARDWDASLKEPPKECALCKRKQEGNGSSSTSFIKYSRFEDVTIQADNGDKGPSAAKKRRRSGNGAHADGSDSGSEGDCAIVKAERKSREEKHSFVCSECEVEFRDTTDVEKLAPCTCSEQPTRRTRTADACDGHRVSCARYRFERLTELRNKHKQWLAEKPKPPPPPPPPPLTPAPVRAPAVATALVRPAQVAQMPQPPRLSFPRQLPPPGAIVRARAPIPIADQKPGPASSKVGHVISSSDGSRTMFRTVSPAGFPASVTAMPKQLPAFMRTKLGVPPAISTVTPVNPLNAPRTTFIASSAQPRRPVPMQVWKNYCVQSKPGTAPGVPAIQPVTAICNSKASIRPSIVIKPNGNLEEDRRITIATINPSFGKAGTSRENSSAQANGEIRLIPDARNGTQSVTRSVPIVAVHQQPAAARPRRIVRRYDTTRMRPVAKTLFDLGLDLVKQFVAKADAKESQANKTTQPSSEEGKKASEKPAEVDQSDQPKQGEPASEVASATAPSTNNVDDVKPVDALKPEFSTAHLAFDGGYCCKFCGFYTESQLVFARHKLTGWLRWVTESEAREIERHLASQKRRNRSKKARSRRSGNGKTKRRRRRGRAGDDDSSSSSFEPPSDDDSNESNDSSARASDQESGAVAKKRPSVTPASELRSSVHFLCDQKDSAGRTIPTFSSEWSIGEDPPDVFLGQCCTCGFLVVRNPRAYTNHLRNKHNIALTVDEATLSVARCPFCPYTQRHRTTVFKQHVRTKCPLRFDASTNQAPPSFCEDLPALLTSHRLSLVHPVIETPVEDVAAEVTRTKSTGSSSIDVSALLDSVNRSHDATLISDSSDDQTSDNEQARKSAARSSQGVTIVSVKPTSGPLRPSVTSNAKLMKHSTSHHELDFDFDSQMEAKLLDEAMALVAADVAPASEQDDAANEYCRFCAKRLRSGTNIVQHFTAGHLFAMRLKVQKNACPLCSASFAGQPGSANLVLLYKHLTESHGQPVNRKAYWWPYLISTLRKAGCVEMNSDEDGEVEDAAAISSEQFDVAKSSKNEIYCIFCAQSMVGSDWKARQHFVDLHLGAVRMKIRKRICPLCSPEQNGGANGDAKAPPTFDDVSKLQAHIEKSHRCLCRAASTVWWPFVSAELNRARRSDIPGTTTSASISRPSSIASAPVANKPAVLPPLDSEMGDSGSNPGIFCSFCAQTITGDPNAHFAGEHLVLVGIQLGRLECPLCNLPDSRRDAEAEVAPTRCSDVVDLIQHVTLTHQAQYRDSFWWSLMNSALSTAAKASSQGLTKSNGPVAANSKSREAQSHSQKTTTQAASSTDQASTAAPSSSTGLNRATTNAAQPKNLKVLDSREACCVFCDKTVAANPLLHFSDTHLNTIRTQIRGGECPLCALVASDDSSPDSSSKHRHKDPPLLQQHIESTHAEEYRDAFWWPYLFATLRTASASTARRTASVAHSSTATSRSVATCDSGTDSQVEEEQQPVTISID